jgi:hypothetical protein
VFVRSAVRVRAPALAACRNRAEVNLDRNTRGI